MKSSISKLIGLICVYVGILGVLFFVASTLQPSDEFFAFFSIAYLIVIPGTLFLVLSFGLNFSTKTNLLISICLSAIGAAIIIAINDIGWIILSLAVVYPLIYFALVAIFHLRGEKIYFLGQLGLLVITAGICIALQNAKLDFYWTLPEYTAIIQDVKSGKTDIRASNAYVSSSKEGQVLFQRDSVYFFFYVYTEQNDIPEGFKCTKIAFLESWFDCTDLDP